MKKYSLIKAIMISILLGTLMYSCSEEFLDVPIKNELLLDIYYQDEVECQAALTGVYDILGTTWGQPSGGGSYFRGLLVVGNVGTDEGIVQRPIWMGDHNNIEYYLTNPSTDLIYLIWENMYRGIARANTLINRIPTEGTPKQLKEYDRIRGEAYFLRAYFYWHLAKFYGGVPLQKNEIQSPEQINYERATINETYDFIIEDLDRAIELLNYKNGGTYASKGAAQTLKGLAYLQMCGPQANNNNSTASEAVTALKSVIDSGSYVLLTNYADIYKESNENNDEIVFNIEFSSAPAEYGQVTAYFGPGNQSLTNSYGIIMSSAEHFYSYDTLNDIRWAHNVVSWSLNSSSDTVGGYYYSEHSREDSLWDFKVNKFRLDLPPFGTNYPYLEWQSPYNYPVLKLSDVLLLYAEAECRANNGPTAAAYDAINQIRNRAGLNDLTAGLNYAAFMDSLLQERSWELCFEGKRWEDLVRFDKLVETVQSLKDVTNPIGAQTIKEYHIFYPIPQIDIDQSGGVLKQNEGY